MIMKKAQKIFLIQIVIAIILFIVFATVTKRLFYNDSDIKSYLSINDGVKEMAGSTGDFLDSLIVRNDVTFDPTSGAELEKVFKNLKNTNKEKFLFVGSSQLRVIQGEKITNTYESLVSKKFEKFTSKQIQTYNLSLGGMSIPEKLIVSKKASEVLNTENILIAVTPWDCLADKIRKGVTTIQNQTFSLKVDTTENLNATNSDLVFPLNVNEKISNSLENTVNNNLTIYAKRTGIKKWMNDGFTSLLTSEKDSIDLIVETPKKSIADYWLTLNQELNNESAWDNTQYKTGKRSLKIVNSKKASSKWEGDIIFLDKPTNTLLFEGWMKAKNVSNDTKLLAIDHKITFEDNTTQWYYRKLRFKKGTHDWQQVKTSVIFDKKVKSIKPHLLFYGGTGTVWFDDITINPVFGKKIEDNIIPNASAEKESKERLNVSYSYNKEEWKKIKENIFKVVDYLTTHKAEKNTFYLLLFGIQIRRVLILKKTNTLLY